MGHPPSNVHVDPASSPTAAGVGALSDYPAALIEVTLERVITSGTFRRSQRHRQFLTHVIRAGLAGQREQLKEVIIGIEVFGRTLPEYDPRRDPIVRVEVGRIREKLARFYEGEGANESFQIVIPVGNYMPLFVRRKFNTHAGRQAHSHALAVLPFANLSGDPDDASFALGLADQLIDTIGRVPGLKVVARLSALKARDAGMDLKAIGKLLGVDHVIEGSLQRSGARIRCIVQLSRTKDSVRVWSQRLEHDTERDDDLFDYQDAIADAVLSEVTSLHAAQINDGHASRSFNSLLPSTTANRDARDLFERARYLSQQRTFDGYRKAIELLERAVAIDPGFAQAHSLLGSAYANRIGFNVEPTFPAFTQVESAARRALELDPLDGEARALLAVVAYRVEYRWHDAEPMFQEALRLTPNSTLVHSSYAWALVFNGHFDDAARHARLSQELDPLNVALRANNAAIAMYARQYDVAIREFTGVLQLEPDHLFSRVVLGVTYMTIGDTDLAMAQFDHLGKVVPTHATPKFCKLCVRGLRGQIEQGRRELVALLEEIGDEHYSRVNLAMSQTCLGDIDGAFASLELAAQARDVLFVSVPAHALFQPLRQDPRYLEMTSRYGLDPLPQLTNQLRCGSREDLIQA